MSIHNPTTENPMNPTTENPNWRVKDYDSGASEDFYAASPEEAVEEAEDWLRGGDWTGYQGEVKALVYPLVYGDDGEIDEKETRLAREENYLVASITVEPEEPECSDSDGHDWKAPHALVGGLKENPGVVGSNHGGVCITVVCRRCGAYRTTDTGATDRRGRRTTVVTHYDPDEGSLAWIAEEEDR